jgi:hypothetical protein
VQRLRPRPALADRGLIENAEAEHALDASSVRRMTQTSGAR